MTTTFLGSHVLPSDLILPAVQTLPTGKVIPTVQLLGTKSSEAWESQGTRLPQEPQGAIPVIDGVHLLLNAIGVDVPIAHQPPARLHNSIDLLLIGVHGGHEVLLFFNSCFSSFQGGGHFSVGQNIFLFPRERTKITAG